MCIVAVLDMMVQTLEEQSLSVSRKEDKQKATCKSAITEILELEGIDKDSLIRDNTILVHRAICPRPATLGQWVVHLLPNY